VADAYHTSVMVAEVVALLEPGRGGVFFDGTLGAGGHARALLDAGATRVIGADRDPEALERTAVCARDVRGSAGTASWRFCGRSQRG
jgi:16S rRNA C1402 N4-methylase RsmH